MDMDTHPPAFRDLEEYVTKVFPGLAGVHFTHRWGGPVSVPMDMAPAIGTIGDARALYSLGCVGHGVSMTQLNGATLADLVLERKTDLTDVWFVNSNTIPWPPEPLRFIASQAIRGYLRLEDWGYERNMPKAQPG
jgi:glycine/D-amino acid oxidase-like deaminating enzyme